MKRAALVLKGAIIGIAGVLPGVSASVLALLLGIYEEILSAVATFGRRSSRLYLSLLAVGAAIGILLAAEPVSFLTERYPLYSYALFAGAVIGGIRAPRPLERGVRLDIKGVLTFLSSAAAVLLMSLAAHLCGAGQVSTVSGLYGPADFAVMLFTGAIACGTMTVPGASGSVMLLLLGQYGTVYNALGAPVRLIAAVSGGLPLSVEIRAVLLLIPFAVGGAVGIFFTARGALLFKKRHGHSFSAAEAGLPFGSSTGLIIYCVLPQILKDFTPLSAAAGLFFFAAGVATSRLFGHKRDAAVAK